MGLFDLQHPTVDKVMLKSVICSMFSPILRDKKIKLVKNTR